MKRIVLALVVGLTAAGVAGQPVEPEDACKSAYNSGRYEDALRECKRLAEQGAEAQVLLGRMYLTGKGIPLDTGEALKWYRRAAEQNNPYAQCRLGLMYHAGQGVTQNFAQAARWFRRAAVQELAEAQYYLGDIYETAAGVPLDYGEAVKWYRLASNQGFDMAQLALGRMYQFGLGVPQDYVQTYLWYTLAERAMPPGVDRNVFPDMRDTLVPFMTPEQVAEAQRLADEWKPKKQ